MATTIRDVPALAAVLGRIPRTLRKPLAFGLWGAAGCLLAALLLGEPLLYLLMPAPPEPPPRPRVDVLFVLDVTGSMQFAIDGVRRGIRQFAEGLSGRDLDAQIGLIAFGDDLIGEKSQVLTFTDGPFTTDPARFGEQVGGLIADGGGDDPESSLDALALAARQPFRPGATRALVLITDAPPNLPDRDISSLAEAASALRRGGIGQLHLMIRDEDRPAYEPLQEAATGQVFSLIAAARGREGFDRILPAVSREIAEATLQGLQSKVAVSTRSFWPLILAIAVWTGALAVGVGLALIAGQNHYLRRRLLDPGEGLQGTGLGLGSGIVAGAAGQWFYQITGGTFFQLLGWTLLGALVGGGMSLFVPNLDRRRALLGGGIGGAAGCLGFLAAAAGLGDVAGRLLGAAALGFFIGLMVGLVEVAFRQVWLEVDYGRNERRNVSLGAVPVSVGSDRTCQVLAEGAPPVAYRYKYEAGRILCEDVVTKQVGPAPPGDRRTAGSLVLTVCSSTSAASASAPPNPPGSTPNAGTGTPARPVPSPPPAPRSTPPAPQRAPQSPPPTAAPPLRPAPPRAAPPPPPPVPRPAPGPPKSPPSGPPGQGRSTYLPPRRAPDPSPPGSGDPPKGSGPLPPGGREKP